MPYVRKCYGIHSSKQKHDPNFEFVKVIFIDNWLKITSQNKVLFWNLVATLFNLFKTKGRVIFLYTFMHKKVEAIISIIDHLNGSSIQEHGLRQTDISAINS